jgi:tight adherence protein C
VELVFGLIFLSVATLVLAGGSMVRPRPVKKRLARLSDGTRAVIEEPVSDTGGLLPRPQNDGWAGLLAPVVGLFGGDEQRAAVGRMRQRLREAGYRQPSALTIFMGSRIVLAVVAPFVTLFFVQTTDFTQLEIVVSVCMAAGIGLVAPSTWLDRRRAARKLEIQNGLPDALDLMVVCVEAGLGVNASLARVSQEFGTTSPIVAAEFELVTLEVRAGKSTTDALRSLAERTAVSEIGSLVAMLVQTERFGTSVADTLRVFADSMRSQRMLRAEEQAGKAPIKMLFPTVVIFMATLIIAIGPGLMQMFAFFGEHE